MPAVVIEIADAVVAVLNAASDAGTLGERFKAERKIVPRVCMDRRVPLLVWVVPRELSMVTLSRRDDDFTYTVDVVIQKTVGQGAASDDEIQAECDALLLLSERIVDLFRDDEIVASIPGRFTGLTNSPMYDIVRLDEHRLFAGLVSPSFARVRSR